MESLNQHVKIVQKYFEQKASEERRIKEANATRLAELERLIYGESISLGNDVYRRVVKDQGALDEKRKIVEQMAANLTAWERRNVPRVEPLDTPERLRKDVAARYLWIQVRRAEVLQSSGKGRVILRDEKVRNIREDALRELYREARGRALAFTRFDLTLADKLPEANDPVIGLQNIIAWCERCGKFGTSHTQPDQPAQFFPVQRRGRLPKAEGDAKRAELLATVCQHPTLKDEPGKLAKDLGISEATVRRWLTAEHEKYMASAASNPPDNEE